MRIKIGDTVVINDQDGIKNGTKATVLLKQRNGYYEVQIGKYRQNIHRDRLTIRGAAWRGSRHHG